MVRRVRDKCNDTFRMDPAAQCLVYHLHASHAIHATLRGSLRSRYGWPTDGRSARDYNTTVGIQSLACNWKSLTNTVRRKLQREDREHSSRFFYFDFRMKQNRKKHGDENKNDKDTLHGMITIYIYTQIRIYVCMHTRSFDNSFSQ